MSIFRTFASSKVLNIDIRFCLFLSIILRSLLMLNAGGALLINAPIQIQFLSVEKLSFHG